jgi:molecular chaperone GrpE (heat shock protein)
MIDALNLRTRAQQCTDVAPKARVDEIREYLLEVADALQEDAAKAESEESGPDQALSSGS